MIDRKTLFILLIPVFLGLFPADSAYGQQNVLSSARVQRAPVLDGAAEDLWNSAPALTVQVFGGANMGTTSVTLRSVHTGDSVYFLAQWADPTESLRRSPWQKQADGSWRKLTDPQAQSGDNNLYYEDKLAFIWNINDSIANFNAIGCLVACHAGEAGKPYGNKYTAREGELGDIWHWKAVRTAPVGQIDDQYLDHTRYDREAAPGAGRKSDPRTGGGYSDNQTEDGRAPVYALPGNAPAPPYWILDSQKVPIDPARYRQGDEVPGIVVAPFTGDRGDITARSVHAGGRWTMEWTRRLDTGSPFDVQFTDLAKSYFFGVAVFDNAQVRHAFNAGALQLRFAR
jgi:hypothetical protein